MKLLDQVRQKLRAGHYACRTEQSLCSLDRAIHSLACRYPQGMAASDAVRASRAEAAGDASVAGAIRR